MSNYTKIDNISVFPISGELSLKYGTMTSNFRVLSETNVSNMWVSVIDKKAFVISCVEDKLGDTLNSMCLEFFILGHYFRVTLDAAFLGEFVSSGKIYATILMGNAPINPTQEDKIIAEHYNYMVVGIHSDDESHIDYFTGVQFTSSTELCPDGTQNVGGRVIVPAGYYEPGEEQDTYIYYVKPYSLELLNYNSLTNSWYIPEDSKKKFNRDSFDNANVDGGEVQ